MVYGGQGGLSPHTPYTTPGRALSKSGLKFRVLKLSFLSLEMMVKSGLEFVF